MDITFLLPIFLAELEIGQENFTCPVLSTFIVIFYCFSFFSLTKPKYRHAKIKKNTVLLRTKSIANRDAEAAIFESLPLALLALPLSPLPLTPLPLTPLPLTPLPLTPLPLPPLPLPLLPLDDVNFAQNFLILKFFGNIFFQVGQVKTALLSSSQKHHIESNSIYSVVCHSKDLRVGVVRNSDLVRP